MGAHRRDRELKHIVLLYTALTVGIVIFLVIVGLLAAIAVLYHYYWGLGCIPAGILIGYGVTLVVEKHGR